MLVWSGDMEWYDGLEELYADMEWNSVRNRGAKGWNVGVVAARNGVVETKGIRLTCAFK